MRESAGQTAAEPAIEEGSRHLLENADFADTDVPFDVELPLDNLPVNCYEIILGKTKRRSKRLGSSSFIGSKSKSRILQINRS